MQDSSSRVRNWKNPAMCTASSRVPGGQRWMPISPLFCHTFPPESRQSCHRSSLYMETDTSCVGTCINTTHTCLIDADIFALLSLNHMNVAEVCTVQTPAWAREGVWVKYFAGNRWLLRESQRQQWRSALFTPVHVGWHPTREEKTLYKQAWWNSWTSHTFTLVLFPHREW